MIALLYLGIVLLAMAAPLMQEWFGYPSGEGIYAAFSPVCHQYPTRSFWILGRPFALCARCTSGYLGLAVAAAFLHLPFPWKRRAVIGIVLVSVAALDPVLQLLGLYESINILRFLTGIIGGIGAFAIIYPIPYHHSGVNP